MRGIRMSTAAFAAAYVVFALGLFIALGGTAYAASGVPSSASDQYGTKAADVSITGKPPVGPAAETSPALPSTGLSLLGTVLVGGALVGLGVALRRRERAKDKR